MSVPTCCLLAAVAGFDELLWLPCSVGYVGVRLPARVSAVSAGCPVLVAYQPVEISSLAHERPAEGRESLGAALIFTWSGAASNWSRSAVSPPPGGSLVHGWLGGFPPCSSPWPPRRLHVKSAPR